MTERYHVQPRDHLATLELVKKVTYKTIQEAEEAARDLCKTYPKVTVFDTVRDNYKAFMVDVSDDQVMETTEYYDIPMDAFDALVDCRTI